jgi:uncharacterized membrane protein
MPLSKKLGIAFVFSWFFFGGIGHFVVADFFTSIVPPYIPYPVAMVYISGVFELAGAIGILISPLRRLAGAGLFLLTLAVTPANINMWLHPEQFAVAHVGPITAHISPTFLSIRLVVQVFLLATIVYSTILPEKKST